MGLIAHVALALVIQFLVARLCRSWAAGAATASAWAISREITQAEYRWIEAFGAGLRANMPLWGGFDVRVWQRVDPWADWLVPTLIVLVVAVVANRRERGPEQSRR